MRTPPPPPLARSIAHRGRVVAWALLALAAAGCESAPAPDRASTPPALDTAPALASAAANAETPVPTRNPLGQGLEIVCVPVDDSRGSVGRALAAFADRPLPVPPAVAESWRSRGLRLVAVPAGDVEAILQGLPLAGSVQRQSFAALTRWTPIAIGGSWTGARLIGGAREPGSSASLVLPSGRLRILARAWDEPTIERSLLRARVRVELLPQHEQFDPDLTALIQAPKRSIDRAGRVFDHLTLAFSADPGEVYLIVPESPRVAWQRAEDASNDQPAAAPSADPETNPRTAEWASLGEAMLSNAELTSSGRVKVVVVLVPRSAGVFTLLPEP